MSVSIVMPCYNEARGIERQVHSFYEEVIEKLDNAELIAVDDASTDQTGFILEQLPRELPGMRVIRMDTNQGHGRAIRAGYEAARRDYVFQVDSDGHFDPRDFWKLYNLREDFDLVLGVRERRVEAPVRIWLARAIKVVNYLLFGVWLADANCPFRLIKRQALRRVLDAVPADALAPNIMMSVYVKKMDLSVAEIPVGYYARQSPGGSPLVRRSLVWFAWQGFKQLMFWHLQ